MGGSQSTLDNSFDFDILSEKMFGGHRLNEDELFNKLSKRINECQKKNITQIYIYFGQGERKYCDKGNARVYYSKQCADFEAVAKFISLYSNPEVSITLQQNPHSNQYFLHINMDPSHENNQVSNPKSKQKQKQKQTTDELPPISDNSMVVTIAKALPAK